MRAARPDGYRSIDAPRSSSGCQSAGQHGGGIVVIYKDSITAKRIQPDFIPRTFEFILTMLKLPRSSFIVFAIYRTGPVSIEFYNELTSMFELLVAYSCPIVMTGDVNIHLDITDERDTRQFNDVLESFGFIQSVRDPTHLHGRILDVVVTRSDLPPPLVQFGLPGEFSDHALLVFQLPIPRPPVCFTNISTRAWRNFDENNFLADLQASPLCSPSVLLFGAICRRASGTVRFNLGGTRGSPQHRVVQLANVINLPRHGLIPSVLLPSEKSGCTKDSTIVRIARMIATFGAARRDSSNSSTKGNKKRRILG